MILLTGCLLPFIFWFTGSDAVEAATLDVYVYNALKEKREFVIFDERTNLATFRDFFLK